jgi:hypothetical protein
MKQLIRLNPGQLTDFGHNEVDLEAIRWAQKIRERTGEALPPVAGGSGTFSNFGETTVLAHLTGQDNASWANLAPTYLALTTVVPDSSKTGSTITEATYTGYARLSVAAANWAAAISGGAGAASTIANGAILTFAACTASSSTVIGWALCTGLTVGNALAWGSASSTVISTTQTPATVAVGALSITLI